MPYLIAIVVGFCTAALQMSYINESSSLPDMLGRVISTLIMAVVAASASAVAAVIWQARANPVVSAPQVISSRLSQLDAFAQIIRTLHAHQFHRWRWRIVNEDHYAGRITAILDYHDDNLPEIPALFPKRAEYSITLQIRVQDVEEGSEASLLWKTYAHPAYMTFGFSTIRTGLTQLLVERLSRAEAHQF